MPVFDWTRSDLAKVRPDGSTTFAYDQRKIDTIDSDRMFEQMESGANGFLLPGWEPERMASIKELFRMYQEIDEDTLFENLCYFLNAVMPACDRYDVEHGHPYRRPRLGACSAFRALSPARKKL